jgi:hypothetical protein
MTRSFWRAAVLGAGLAFSGWCGVGTTAQGASLTWDWTLTSFGSAGSGTFTTDPLSGGSYLITDMTGSFSFPAITNIASGTITGLLPAGTTGPGIINDDLLYPTAPQLDGSGIAFMIGGDVVGLIFDAPDSAFLFYDATTNSNYLLDVNDTFVATLTPLPAALPLFATGLGALGLLGWRRKQRSVT